MTKSKAATQTASALQSAISSEIAVSAPTASQLEAVSQSLDDAVICMMARFGSAGAGGVLTQLESATTNTKERYLAYQAYNLARAGTSRAAANTDSALKCK